MRDLTSPAGDLEPIERASADELHALQLERLRWSLRHAYANVPHYHAAFDAAGVHPDDCKDLADLAKYPLTSKADLRENYPFGMFAVPREQIVRVHASSGTTGRATVAQECVETKDGLHIWEDHFYPEVVDPLTGETLPDGEEGELVFTSLTK